MTQFDHAAYFTPPSHRDLPTRIKWMLVATGLCSIAALVVLAVWMSGTVNDLENSKAQALANSVISTESERLNAMTEDYADWQTAYEWIIEGADEEVYVNIGTSASETTFFDLIHIYDADDTLLYAYGNDTEESDLSLAAPEFAHPFLTALRDLPTGTYQSVNGFAYYGDTPALVSAGRVMPGDLDVDVDQGLPVLLNVTFLTPELLAAKGQSILMDGLSISPGSQPGFEHSVPLRDMSGAPIAALRWAVATSGQHMLTRSAWIIAALAILLIVGHYSVARLSAHQLHLYLEERAQARTDKLTGLLNRAAFDEYLATPQCQAAIAAGQLSVLYLDLDKFKGINDVYGHAIGDKALKVMARRLQDATREDDVLARIGGDEFAVLLHDTAPLEAARRVSDRLIAAARHQVTLADGRQITVHASIGSVAATPSSNWRKLLLQADAAMYVAKRTSQNRSATSAVAFSRADASSMDEVLSTA